MIRAEAYDRSLAFFEQLTAAHPSSWNAWLNYGLAHVDKIPSVGSISQVILANKSIGCFSKALEIEESWVALYTRGNAYLFWPKVFERAPLGVADLEKALALQRFAPTISVHERTYIALGEGYWKTEQPKRASETWRAGLVVFPNSGELAKRLEMDAEGMEQFLKDHAPLQCEE